MIVSPGLFAVLIVVALVVVSVSPLILLGLWIADFKKGDLW